jgi:hypothetical protein
MGLIDNTVWSGKDAQGFYSDALVTGGTRKLFRKELRVKSDVNVHSLDLGNFLQPDACKMAELGNYTLGGKKLTVCSIGFKIPFCTLDWERTYLSEELAAGANNDPNFPSSAVDYISGLIREGIDSQVEYLTFQGDTAASPADLCDGLEKQLLADGTVIDVAAVVGELGTSGTVVAGLTKIYNKIPEVVHQKQKGVFMVNIATAAAYRLALASGSNGMVWYNQGNYQLMFIDRPMVVAPGLGADKAIYADPQNFVWGTDLEDDEMTIQFIQDPTNPKTSYAIGSFKFGVMHLVGKEIVYYN